MIRVLVTIRWSLTLGGTRPHCTLGTGMQSPHGAAARPAGTCSQQSSHERGRALLQWHLVAIWCCIAARCIIVTSSSDISNWDKDEEDMSMPLQFYMQLFGRKEYQIPNNLTCGIIEDGLGLTTSLDSEAGGWWRWCDGAMAPCPVSSVLQPGTARRVGRVAGRPSLRPAHGGR